MVIPNKNKWLFWGQLVIAWSVAFLIFGFLRNYGWPETEGFKPEFYDAPGLSSTLGLVVGSGYFIIELLMNRRGFRRMSFGRWAGLKSIMHLGLVVVLFSLAVVLYPIFSGAQAQEIVFREVLFSKLFLVILFYFSLVSLLITLFMQMNQKLGRGIFKNMLAGKYHHPREEERIFLFIDLRSSTSIAEKLGHVQFSRLIQDCFADITDAVLRHDAEIYQYVGDEVILCWKSRPGLKNNNCLEAYFHYTETLSKRSPYYQKEYGLQPVFKAGAHLGRTTVAEVGILKKELAYHGDVLNTAARIQSKCNEIGELLLISPTLLNALPLSEAYNTKAYAPVKLIGKEEEMAVIGVQRA